MTREPFSTICFAATAIVILCLLVFIGRVLHRHDLGVLLTGAGFVGLVGALAFWRPSGTTRE